MLAILISCTIQAVPNEKPQPKNATVQPVMKGYHLKSTSKTLERSGTVAAKKPAVAPATNAPKTTVLKTNEKGKAHRGAKNARSARAMSEGDTSGMSWGQLANRCRAGQCSPKQQEVYEAGLSILP